MKHIKNGEKNLSKYRDLKKKKKFIFPYKREV